MFSLENGTLVCTEPQQIVSTQRVGCVNRNRLCSLYLLIQAGPQILLQVLPVSRRFLGVCRVCFIHALRKTPLKHQQCLSSAALLTFIQDTMSATTCCWLQVGASMCENFIRICYKVGHLLVSPPPLGAYTMLLVARIFGETIFKGLFKKQNKINKKFLSFPQDSYRIPLELGPVLTHEINSQ